MIYLDNSSTTRLLPEVVEAMLPYIIEEYGNPSSKHYSLAVNAKNAVDEARFHVAQLMGCQPEEIIFTSGSTESNNMVLKGVMDYYADRGEHLVVSKTEHSSVMETAKYLQSKGAKVTYLDVDRYGRIYIEKLEEIIVTERPVLVSVIWGNNEIGSLNDIVRIAKCCEGQGVFFHSDATQVLGKVNIREQGSLVHFLSCSAHKLHGPKGIGACVIRKDRLGLKTKLTPLIHGGGQEHEYRSGTLAVHNIVGFGAAAAIALRDEEKNKHILENLEQYLVNKLVNNFKEIIVFNSDTTNKIPGIVNVQFKGTNNELLLKKLSDKVALSTGSACSSSKPSHVLENIGLTLNEIRSSVRISMSHTNTVDEINAFCDVLAGK
ncbi:cysteine desulfurase family protein [Paenibacillus elgii]